MNFDLYDYKKVEKLNERRSMQWLKLYGKMMDSRDKGDEKALEKAREGGCESSRQRMKYVNERRTKRVIIGFSVWRTRKKEDHPHHERNHNP